MSIEKLINIALNEVGYLEKADRCALYEKTANAGGRNYTKYWEDIRPSWQGQPWCAIFVTWCFTKAFGEDVAKKLLKHYPFTYCPKIATLFEQHNQPKRGDIVVFYRKKEFAHTGIVVKADGDYFETVEGNTDGGSSVIANGGGVHKKSYYASALPGTKFLRPNYPEGEKSEMIYNYIDKNMPEWARESVQWAVDNGIIQGDGNGLALTDDKLWVLVVLKRFAELLKK
ncbi:MAG: CHAP domain-containing protein [Clostridia bacterium]|nr:CHAP domain-containing protein [Clostridia bacterium]